ncbi:MAG: hypothetical protein L3K26_18495 [Candidatus Hydrogenedentes bacterium]|nr:hypothetical protein [Candidatus Hydrogenedentota bacterium]
MKLITLAGGEAWMTEEEIVLNRQFVRGVDELLRDRGVGENPLLALRVNDVVVSWLLVRRMEMALAEPEGPEETTPTTPAQVDAIGKSRERLRKSIKDLEEYCARAGTPIDTGLADVMKPVIQQVQGSSPFFGAG